MALPPVSYGYANAAITADKLPIWQQPLSNYRVYGKDDWKVSTLRSIDRGLRIEAGTGSGDGVTDTTPEYETMSLPSPPIPSRWSLIVRRRNWSGEGTTTLVAIPATASATQLPARKNVPGSESDQPLAFVLVTQKDTTIQQVIDLRCWASNGGLEAAHELALQYLAAPGAAVKIGSTVWRYELQANGVWDWRAVDAGRPTLVLSGTDAPAPIMEAGTVTVRTDANGATAIPFKARFPRALNSVFIQHAMASNLGLIQFRFDKALSNPGRAAFFAFDNAGNRLRNTTGIRVSYLAVGD